MLDHFAISTISSPQTLGAPVTGGTDPGTGIVFTVTPLSGTLNTVKAVIPTTGKVFGRLSGTP